jgi:hypothetical protein
MTRRSELGCSAAPRGGPQKRKCAAPPLTSLRSSEYTVAQSCAATHVDACATVGVVTRTSPGDACTVLAPQYSMDTTATCVLTWRTVDACGRDAMPPRRRRKWKHLLVGRDSRSHHDASKRACARTKLPTVTLARATARRDAATSDDTCLATDVAACTAEVTDGQQNRSRRSAGWRRSSSR